MLIRHAARVLFVALTLGLALPISADPQDRDSARAKESSLRIYSAATSSASSTSSSRSPSLPKMRTAINVSRKCAGW